jgi:hypothetical protein
MVLNPRDFFELVTAAPGHLGPAQALGGGEGTGPRVRCSFLFQRPFCHASQVGACVRRMSPYSIRREG